MGPIRAYSRPSHGAAAGEFVTSSSPYSHSRNYSSRHDTFCVHTTPLDDAQHSLYIPVCTSDTLRVGLPSPSASLQPTLFHIKKLLPPGEASTDPHPTHSSQQQDGEGTEQDRWGTGVEQEQKEEEELEENEWAGGGSGRGNVGWHVEEEECHWKKEKNIQKWKRISREQQQCSESDHNTKCRRRVGQCKRKIEESGTWETKKDNDDDHPWKKSRNSYNVKENNSHSSLKIISESAQSTREDGYNHSGTADNKNTEWQKKEFAEFVAPKLSPSPAGSTDEACSSRMALVFPFSDDEEDEERGTEGGKHEIWPISDIVETEDEEGGQQETRGCCSLIFSAEDVSGGDNVGEDCSDSGEGVCGGSVGSEEDAGGGCGEGEEYRYVGGGGGGDSDDEGGCDRDEDSGEGDGDEYEEENAGMGCGQSVGCKVTVKIRGTARSSEPDQVNILITQKAVESGSVAGGDVVGGGGRGGDKGNDRGDSRTANAQDRTGNKHDQPDPLHSSFPDYADVPQEEEDLRANDEGNTSPDEDNEEVDERRGDGEDSPRDSGVRATQRLRPRSYRQFLLTRERRSRVFLKQRSYQLGRWFVTHFTHPYPSKDQKDQLANRTNMTRNQVSEWFGNMRRRIREATRSQGVCWEHRVRLYNSVITGKSEPLPIQPGDAINTWTPPVADESNSLDQPEVSVSPKFKTTLLQRYLNNSGDTQTPSPAASPSLEDSPLRHHHHRHHKEGNSANQHHHSCQQGCSDCFTHQENQQQSSESHHQQENSTCPYRQQQQQQEQDDSTPTNCSVVLSVPLPLSTSSPKERFQALWNSSFEHVKDPAGVLTVSDHRVGNVHGGIRGRGDEGNKTPRKYERNTNSQQVTNNYNNVTGFKRQRTTMVHNIKEGSESYTSLLPHHHQQSSSSTSSILSVGVVGREEWKGSVSNSRVSSGGLGNILHLPSWTSRTSHTLAKTNWFTDGGGVRPQVFRQPEEIAAAYTLMQLQHM